MLQEEIDVGEDNPEEWYDVADHVYRETQAQEAQQTSLFSSFSGSHMVVRVSVQQFYLSI